MARVDVKGFSEAARALRTLAYRAPRLVAPCLARALEPVRDAMEAAMPVDTGNMRSHVEIKVRPPRRGFASAEVRVATSYAFHVDEGTMAHPADHFAEDAADQQQRRSIEILAREIGKVIDNG